MFIHGATGGFRRTHALGLVDLAIESSRIRAIENSARLISDIERHHEANGQYPQSLVALFKDYKPAVKGVEQYHLQGRSE